MRRLIGLLTVGLVPVGATLVQAQQSPSLAEVARQEAERRKATKTPGKVYTNADVKRNTPPPPVPAPSGGKAAEAPPASAETPSSAPKPATSAQAGTAAPAPAPAPAAEPARDENWYRKRMAELTEQHRRNQLFAEALQSRVNALWADFTARDDPAQRDVIEKDRNQALAELDRVKRDIVKLEQAIADFEEEARRAGVPPGWLR